jgi:Ca-activated chloride channel homolog
MTHLRRNVRRCAALFIMLLLPGLLPLSAKQASSNDDTAVNLLFTAINKNGKQLVTTLRKEDVRVLEDGLPQIITDFKQQADQPVAIVIMLDLSVSQEKTLPVQKQVARQFIDSFIRLGVDSVGVITFTGEAKLEQELTSELQRVRQAIERIEFKPPEGYIGSGAVKGKPPEANPIQVLQGSTSLWDSLGFAMELISARASADARRVIVLLTDGADSSSKNTLNDAAEMAIKSGVAVYSIGIGDEYYGGVNEDMLRKISERTAGRAVFPKKTKDLPAAFSELEQALRSQYLVSYSSASTKPRDKMRKIKIEIINPELRKQGLQLSYQQGYYAKKG